MPSLLAGIFFSEVTFVEFCFLATTYGSYMFSPHDRQESLDMFPRQFTKPVSQRVLAVGVNNFDLESPHMGFARVLGNFRADATPRQGLPRPSWPFCTGGRVWPAWPLVLYNGAPPARLDGRVENHRSISLVMSVGSGHQWRWVAGDGGGG